MMTVATHESLIDGLVRTLQQRAFCSAYAKTFEVVRADSDAMKEKVFRLRHDVYCMENHFIRKPSSDSGMELDSYDLRSVHYLLMHRASGEAVGTVRVTPPNSDRPLASFELQQTCDHPLLQIDKKISAMCEISRFCMTGNFRRRPMDGKLLPAYCEQETDESGVLSSLLRRSIPYAPLGLMMAAFEAAMDQGVTDCIMAVEPDQMAVFKRLGLTCRVLGPRIDMHGVSQPLILNILAVLDGMKTANPECWEIVSDKGRLRNTAATLFNHDWHDSVFDHEVKDRVLNKLT